jgi:hypothetical protein
MTKAIIFLSDEKLLLCDQMQKRIENSILIATISGMELSADKFLIIDCRQRSIDKIVMKLNSLKYEYIAVSTMPDKTNIYFKKLNIPLIAISKTILVDDLMKSILIEFPMQEQKLKVGDDNKCYDIPDDFPLLKKMNMIVCGCQTEFDMNKYLDVDALNKTMRPYFDKNCKLGTESNYYHQLISFVETIDDFPFNIMEEYQDYKSLIDAKYRELKKEIKEEKEMDVITDTDYQMFVDKFKASLLKCRNKSLRVIGTYVMLISETQPDMIKVRLDEFINTSIIDSAYKNYIDLESGIWKFSEKQVIVPKDFCELIKNNFDVKNHIYEWMISKQNTEQYSSANFFSREFSKLFGMTYTDAISTIDRHFRYKILHREG